jgi:hypothetical protein
VAIRHADASATTVAALRTALRFAALDAARLAASADLVAMIVDRYDLHPDDVDAWRSTVRWTLDPTDLDPARLAVILDRAASFGLVPADLPVAALVD